MKIDIKDFVGVYEDAFSKEYCDSIIKHFEELSEAGLTETRQQSDPNVSKVMKDDEQLFSHESSKITYCVETVKVFNKKFWGEIYPHYANTYDVLKSCGPHGNYAFKVQKTKIGGGYHLWHSEASSKEVCDRLMTWILYLNDVEEGGETEFLYYPRRIKPKAGTLILWPGSITHTHRGNPPISNEKYIVTGWLEF